MSLVHLVESVGKTEAKHCTNAELSNLVQTHLHDIIILMVIIHMSQADHVQELNGFNEDCVLKYWSSVLFVIHKNKICSTESL